MSGEKILIVEDENIVAIDLELRLKGFGYTVVGVATFGELAVSAAAASRPHLVVMDINLRGEKDGIQAAVEIRDLGIPVVFLTAHGDPATVERAQAAEPYGYLIKPFDESELEDAIRDAVDKHTRESAGDAQRSARAGRP